MEKNTAIQPEKKRGGKAWIIVLVIILVLAAIAGAGVYVWYNFIRDTGEYERYQFDTEAMAGRIQRLSEEEIQAELSRVIEEGMFNISIASAIVFESPEGEGEARIENIAANHYHMQVDILLDDTREVVYSSNLIRPGFSIENIKLTRPLEPGEYSATAIFSAITQEEMQLFGQAGAQVKLYVLDENGKIPEPTPTPTPEPTEKP